MMDEADVLHDLDQLRSRYDVLRLLGRDGECEVYAVRSRDSERHYAVKVVTDPGARSARPDALHVWHAHTVRALDHPKLMVLHAVHHLQGGAVAIAMDRRRGQTLAEVLEETGPFSVHRVERVVRDVGEALAYLHGRGVVHRGVRPQSVFLDRDSGYARLAHFALDRVENGAATIIESEAALAAALAYIAPEQLDGKGGIDDRSVSARTDLYSLGLVAYAMLTGKQPWGDAEPAGLAARRRKEPLPPIDSIRSDVPPHLCTAIERCLERSPRRRWSSAEDLLQRLDDPGEPAEERGGIDLPGIRARLGDGLSGLRSAIAGGSGPSARLRIALAAAGVAIGVIAASVLRGSDEPITHVTPEMRSDFAPVAESIPAQIGGIVDVDRAEVPGATYRLVPIPSVPAADGTAPGYEPSEPSATRSPGSDLEAAPAPVRRSQPDAPRFTVPRPRQAEPERGPDRTEPGIGNRFAGSASGSASARYTLLGEPVGRVSMSSPELLGEPIPQVARRR